MIHTRRVGDSHIRSGVLGASCIIDGRRGHKHLPVPCGATDILERERFVFLRFQRFQLYVSILFFRKENVRQLINKRGPCRLQ